MRADPTGAQGQEEGVWGLGRWSCFSACIEPTFTDQAGSLGPAPWVILMAEVPVSSRMLLWGTRGGRHTCSPNGPYFII